MPQQNVFLGLPDIMSGIRLCPANSFWTLVDASGNTYNFKDLGLQVIGYTGAGMAPVINQTTPYALIGGSYYQRTVPGPRTLTLLCYIDADNLRGLQLLRKVLESYIAPDTSTQQAAQIKLRYALTNYCGDVIGTVLEMACNYVSGLEGNVDNLNQERFALQFIEYAPPSIKELATNSNALGFTNGASVLVGLFLRSTAAVWSRYINAAISAVVYDLNNDLWAASNAGGGPWVWKNGVSVLNTAAAVHAMAYSVSNVMYIGGAFTSPNPQNWIAKWNGASWDAVGATINGVVRGLAFAPNGDLYAVGDFAAPNNRAAKWNGSAWSQLTAGANLNNAGRGVAAGKDGNMYIVGSFTTADGITVNGVTKYNIAAGTYSAMPSTGTAGIAGGGAIVWTVAIGPDGKVYIGGNFTSAGGITAKYVAVWNGTSWQPLGSGLNDVVFTLAFDRNNVLYAVGSFTATGDGAYPITSGVAKWNGSAWLPMDIDTPVAASNIGISFGASNEIAVTANSGTNGSSVPTTINNTGSANAIPTFVFTGPGKLLTIINNTTGKYIYFNYTLLAGETATLVLNPVALSFTSNFFGNVINKILPGSDLATFSLKPGTNLLSCLIAGTTSGATSATLQYRNTHWHFDAGVA